MMKKNKKCDTCNGTGYFTNPFDQTYKCDCMKKPRKPRKPIPTVEEIDEIVSDLPLGVLKFLPSIATPQGRAITKVLEKDTRMIAEAIHKLLNGGGK